MRKRDLQMEQHRLMIPGPIQLAPDVLAEMAKPIVPHYGDEWTAFYNETLDLVRSIVRTDGDVFLIPGSGSAALDAAIGSSLAGRDKALILSNGFFGERLAEIATRYRPNTVVLESPVDKPLSPSALHDALRADPDITLVGAVHSESSSGLLNPVEELAAVCRENDVLFLCDAVSSLGAIDFQMDSWEVDFCVSASQKCLEGPPGIGLVAMGSRAWERIQFKSTPGWYLNLHVWKQYAHDWSDWHPYPITMAVPALRSLRRGLEHIVEEGLTTRFDRHRESARLLRAGMSDLGFAPVFAEACASPTVVAAYGRSDAPANEVVARLASEHRIRIAKGMGSFNGRTFRVGNMGEQARPDQRQVLLDALAQL